MHRFAIALLASLSVGLLLGGCAPYVNIPHQPGDLASHNPNNASVQRVTRIALDYTLMRYPPRDIYMVALPPGSNMETYRFVLKDLPDGGGIIGQGMGDEPVYEVATVYIRGADAQVDIIPPAIGTGQPRLFTVYLDYTWTGWRVERARQWNIPVEQALRATRRQVQPVTQPDDNVLDSQPRPAPAPEPGPATQPEPTADPAPNTAEPAEMREPIMQPPIRDVDDDGM
jgi:hypothetical protein